MVCAVQDYCQDHSIDFDDIEPTAFFYRSRKGLSNDLEVRAGTLSGNMGGWAGLITDELLDEPTCEGFFVAISIVDCVSGQTCLMISEQAARQGRMSTFLLDAEYAVVDSEYINPTFLEGIDATVH